MNDTQIQAAFQFLTTDHNMGIVYGVLKRLHVDPRKEYYEDLVSEGILAFIKAYGKYETELTTNEPLFRTHAFQFVKCRLLDYLRRQTRQASHAEFSLDNDQMTEEMRVARLGTALAIDSQASQFDNSERLTILFEHATLNEQRYMMDCGKLGMSMKAVAAKYGVTPAAVSKWKKQLHRRAEELFND